MLSSSSRRFRTCLLVLLVVLSVSIGCNAFVVGVNTRHCSSSSSPCVLLHVISNDKQQQGGGDDDNTANNNDGNNNNKEEEEVQPPSFLPTQPQSLQSQTSLSSSPNKEKPLDPLIVSLTRNDRIMNDDGAAKSVNIPILGDVPMDGSFLLVVLPAFVIGIVGFVTSIHIAMKSQDVIVNSLVRFSEDVTAAAVAKTNTAAPLVLDDTDGGLSSSSSSCRGICSTTDEDLQGLKTFMQSLRK